jgi:Mrp family chromosome partitioning ATPase/capsular polysaccharide biosynthesis protein
MSSEAIGAGLYRSLDLEDPLPTDLAPAEHSDLRAFLALLRRHVVLIVSVALVTAAGTYLVTAREPKQYLGTSTLLLSPTSTAANATTPSGPSVDTIVGIGTSTAVLRPVAQRLGLSVSDLRRNVSVAGSSSTLSNLITISSTSTSPTRAAAVTNAVGQSLISYLSGAQANVLRSQIAALQQQVQAFSGRTDPSSLAAATDLRTQIAQATAELHTLNPELSVLTPASIPSGPDSPHPTRDAAIGLLAGLVLGVMLAALRDRLDRRIRGIDEIETIYHAPVLGLVPFIKRRTARAHTVVDFSRSGELAEAYRSIRTNLALVRPTFKDGGVIVVTSAIAGEGKSAVAANLGRAFAVIGTDVLLVSADLHNPSLHRYFERSAGANGSKTPAAAIVETTTQGASSNGAAGLAEVLADEISLGEALQKIPLSEHERTGGGSLSMLANGSTFFDPAVLFNSDAMRRFVAEATQQYDVVVFDTPPILANPDALLLAQRSGSVVLVARLEQLTKTQARRTLHQITASHQTVAGVIVMGDLAEGAYGYGYGYGAEQKHKGLSPSRP